MQQQPHSDNQKSSLSWNDPTPVNKQIPLVQQQTPKTTEPETSSRRISSIVAITVLVIALLVWGIGALREKPGTTVSTTASSTSQTQQTQTATQKPSQEESQSSVAEKTATVTSASFMVANQTAGTKVAVEGLSVESPLWVVVYDSVDGKPGNVLGAAMVFPGQTSVDVPLLRATTAGKTYLVGEAKPNGESHEYSRDLSRLDVWTSFVAQ